MKARLKPKEFASMQQADRVVNHDRLRRETKAHALD